MLRSLVTDNADNPLYSFLSPRNMRRDKEILQKDVLPQSLLNVFLYRLNLCFKNLPEGILVDIPNARIRAESSLGIELAIDVFVGDHM